MGIIEIVLALLIISVLYALGRYGRDTWFGFGGSILLGIFTTPLIAFIVISFFFKKH
ncbi:hypothetical protein [Pedobacter sp. KBS0701]|uniref:hypothetical protein n=1 Tax=unclassified Pedobacter TaxID=2628915 RepID=UPI00143D5BF1|nr:hypothetical protein [Pedobacter sp. KBS0701]